MVGALVRLNFFGILRCRDVRHNGVVSSKSRVGSVMYTWLTDTSCVLNIMIGSINMHTIVIPFKYTADELRHLVVVAINRMKSTYAYSARLAAGSELVYILKISTAYACTKTNNSVPPWYKNKLLFLSWYIHCINAYRSDMRVFTTYEHKQIKLFLYCMCAQ